MALGVRVPALGLNSLGSISSSAHLLCDPEQYSMVIVIIPSSQSCFEGGPSPHM